MIEAGLDKSRGPVASLIVQNGTLKKGDVVVCGEAFGKVNSAELFLLEYIGGHLRPTLFYIEII